MCIYMKSTMVLVFDKKNSQQDYQYMARNIETKELEIGYIAVEKPWYSPDAHWLYWLIKNKYGNGGFCGGSSDLGFERIKVDKETIEPFTQTSQIKYHQEHSDIDIKLIEKYSNSDSEDNVIAVIKSGDKIPYKLWNK